MGKESWNSLEAPWAWVSGHQPQALQPWLCSARPLILPPAPLWADVQMYQLPGLWRRWVSFWSSAQGTANKDAIIGGGGGTQPLCPALCADRRNYFYPALLLTDLAFCSAGWR